MPIDSLHLICCVLVSATFCDGVARAIPNFVGPVPRALPDFDSPVARGIPDFVGPFARGIPDQDDPEDTTATPGNTEFEDPTVIHNTCAPINVLVGDKEAISEAVKHMHCLIIEAPFNGQFSNHQTTQFIIKSLSNKGGLVNVLSYPGDCSELCSLVEDHGMCDGRKTQCNSGERSRLKEEPVLVQSRTPNRVCTVSMPCVQHPDYAKLLAKIVELKGQKVMRAEFNIFRGDEDMKCSTVHDPQDHGHICRYIMRQDKELCQGLWEDWPANQTCSSKMDCHRLFGMESCKCFVQVRCHPIYDEAHKVQLEAEKKQFDDWAERHPSLAARSLSVPALDVVHGSKKCKVNQMSDIYFKSQILPDCEELQEDEKVLNEEQREVYRRLVLQEEK